MHRLVTMTMGKRLVVPLKADQRLRRLLNRLVHEGYLLSVKTATHPTTGNPILNAYLRYITTQPTPVPVSTSTSTLAQPAPTPSSSNHPLIHPRPAPVYKNSPSVPSSPTPAKGKNATKTNPLIPYVFLTQPSSSTQTPTSTPSSQAKQLKQSKPISNPTPTPLPTPTSTSPHDVQKQPRAVIPDIKTGTPALRGVKIYYTPGKPSLAVGLVHLSLLNKRQPHITSIIMRSNGELVTGRTALKLRVGGTLVMTVW